MARVRVDVSARGRGDSTETDADVGWTALADPRCWSGVGVRDWDDESEEDRGRDGRDAWEEREEDDWELPPLLLLLPLRDRCRGRLRWPLLPLPGSVVTPVFAASASFPFPRPALAAGGDGLGGAAFGAGAAKSEGARFIPAMSAARLLPLRKPGRAGATGPPRQSRESGDPSDTEAPISDAHGRKEGHGTAHGVCGRAGTSPRTAWGMVKNQAQDKNTAATAGRHHNHRASRARASARERERPQGTRERVSHRTAAKSCAPLAGAPLQIKEVAPWTARAGPGRTAAGRIGGGARSRPDPYGDGDGDGDGDGLRVM